MALKLLHRLWSDRSGTVLMEFVIAFPPWLLLILGIMQFSMVAIARLVVLYAAHAGARAAMVAGNDPAKMQAAAERAARQVCALVLQVETSSAGRRSIPGWGELPGSGSVEDLVTVPVLVSVGGFLPEPAPETPALPASPKIMAASIFPAVGAASTALYIEDKLVTSPPKIWNAEDTLVHVRVEMEFPLIFPVINALIGHRLERQRLYWNPFADGGIWGNRSGGSQGGSISGFDTGYGSYYISLTSDVQMVRPFALADKGE